MATSAAVLSATQMVYVSSCVYLDVDDDGLLSGRVVIPGQQYGGTAHVLQVHALPTNRHVSAS